MISLEDRQTRELVCLFVCFFFPVPNLFFSLSLLILQVIVINKGSIAERGTHDELIAKGGVYKKLVLRQLNTDKSGKVTNGTVDGLNIQIDEDADDLDW